MSPQASLGLGPSFHVEKMDMAPILVDPRRPQSRDDSSHTELIVRFAVWALQLHRFPTVAQVESRFAVCRATAYRWRNALAAALGIATPPNLDDAGEER